MKEKNTKPKNSFAMLAGCLLACLLLAVCCLLPAPAKAAESSKEHYLKPYQNTCMGDIYNGDASKSFKMMGKEYHYGAAPTGYVNSREVLYNLDGQFDRVTLYIGAIDGAGNVDALAYVYMDGDSNPVDIWSLNKGMMTLYKELDTKGVTQLRIVMKCVDRGDIFYGIGDVIGYGGHFYKEELTKSPTAEKDGLRTYTCEVCGHSYTEKVPALKYCEPMLEPYQLSNLRIIRNTGDRNNYTTVMGKKYYDAILDKGYVKSRTALFALNQEYKSITFTVGHRDNAGGPYTKLSIYADNSSYPMKEVELTWGMIDKKITLDTEGVTQLKLSFQSNGDDMFYVIHSISYERVTPKSHNYEQKETLAADYGRTGIRTYTCKDCKLTYTEVIPALQYDISKAELTLSKTSYSYNGTARKPSVTVKYNGAVLVKNTDYTVSYKDNIKAGKATVTVTGKGSYSGKLTAKFTIEEDDEDLEFSVGDLEYATVSSSQKTVKVIGIENEKATAITIPATVKYGSKTYKVVAVDDKAFYKETQITSIIIGKNVQTIGQNAFASCSKLSKITVNATDLKSVGKNALKKTKKNIQIVVPAKKADSYKKLFSDKGQTIKVVTK